MAELVLVRHAQAAFGTDDYDRLTELGHRQARWLGEYFAERAIEFDRVVTGTLRRHRETLAGIAEALPGCPRPRRFPGWTSTAPTCCSRRIWAGAACRCPSTPRTGAGTSGCCARRSMPGSTARSRADAHLCFPEFEAGVRQALEAARHGAERVLVVSSGGPISTAVGAVLGVAPRTVVDLNLQTRNTGLSELRAGAQRAHCVSFNAVPHLERRERREAITYS